jgi:hypothetical protein
MLSIIDQPGQQTVMCQPSLAQVPVEQCRASAPCSLHRAHLGKPAVCRVALTRRAG